MKRLIAFILFSAALACAQTAMPIVGSTWKGSGAASPSFSLVQFKYNSSAGGGTGGSGCTTGQKACTVTVSAIGAGHLVFVFDFDGNSAVNALASVTSSGGAGDTWTHCAGAHGCSFTTAGTGNTDGSYVLSAAGGETSITCNITNNSASYMACGVIEYSSTTSVTFDTSNGGTDSLCTTCAGVALTLAGTNDVIIQLALPGDSISAISNASYTDPKQFYDGAGLAGWKNTTTGTAPNWTQGSTASVTVMAIAFKD